jgi:hypothetical protein
VIRVRKVFRATLGSRVLRESKVRRVFRANREILVSRARREKSD